VNIWQSYKQERDCFVHFFRLLAACWPSAQVVYYKSTLIKKATVPKSQNVKDSSHGNKYLRKIEINLGTKVEICISTYSNADVVCYSATD